MSAPDPKPAARIVASRDEWDLICDLKDGPCRVGTGSHWVDKAHLVPRSQGGDDIPDNIIPLGHEAHMLYHDRGKGWEHVAHMIRDSLTLDEWAYVLRKKGPDWLAEHYPAGDTGPLCAKCRRPLKAQKSGELEKPRARKRYGFQVPADQAEDGAAILDGMVERCAELLAGPLGYSPETPKFNVISSVLGWFILNFEDDVLPFLLAEARKAETLREVLRDTLTVLPDPKSPACGIQDLRHAVKVARARLLRAGGASDE